MFPIMFKTGQALPLVVTRIPRPRMSRGGSAGQPRNIIGPRPRQQRVRERDFSKHRAHPRIVHVHDQSAIALCPRPLTRQGTVLGHGQAPASAIREQAMAAAKPCPRPVRDFSASTSATAPLTGNLHGSQLAMACPRQRIRVSVGPPSALPVHIHFIPAYGLI